MSTGERAKSDFYHWCSLRRSCILTPMNRATTDGNAASSVAQNNQGRARVLGRGTRSTSTQQSPHKLNKLKILQCNINGLTTLASRVKLDQLLELAEKNCVQIIALQETKLKISTRLKYRGYNIYRKDRTSSGGGGLAFFIRDINYQSVDIPVDQTSGLEIQGIKIAWKGRPLNIFNVYFPPGPTQMPHNFSSLMDRNTLIMGDLNAKHTIWGSSNNNVRGSDILQMMDDREFLILNDGSHTHSSYSYDTSEVLDISLTSSHLYSQCSWSVLDNIGSDHLPILIEFKKRQKTYYPRENFWNFKKANWTTFRDLIDNDLVLTPLTDNLEDSWRNFRNIMIKHAKTSIPRGNVKKYVPNYMHQSSTLRHLLEERKLLSENADLNSRININKINAEIKLTYSRLKRSKWMDLCSQMDAKTSNTKLWKIVKGISKEQPQYEDCNSVKDTNGQIFQDDKAAANGIAGHYQKISSLAFTDEDKILLRKARNITHGCRTTDHGDPSLQIRFSMQELLLAMGFLDLNKSPGPDGLYGQMLENLSCNGKQRLLDIFNLSWETGRLPREWKRATIIPIKKPNKNSCNPDDFRPIALTSIASKLIEKMILLRLHYFLDRNNLLPAEQYGFRKGHSTTDLVLFFAQTIRDAQNLKPTHHSVAAFLDLTKAFDRLWKQKLIIKLHDSFKFRGKLLAWISDFMHHRLIRVKVNKTLSDSFRLSQGVPQGTVLSPTLFSLYLAGAEKVVSPGTNIGLFADDIAIWCSGVNIQELETRLNDSLKSLKFFGENLKLCFNPTKSITSFFTTNKHLYNYQPKIIFDGQFLTYNKHPKYLGITLDPEMTCNKHIESITLKARKRLCIMKYIAGRDWGADASTLRTTYMALVRPILEFGHPIYCCASDTNLRKLELVQLSAARIITGLKRSCPSDVVLFEADLQPLHLRRQANLVKYFSKLSSYGSQNNTSSYLNSWKSNQRLKRNSPFSYVASKQLLHCEDVEPHHPKICFNPSEDLPGVHFYFNFSDPVLKKDFIPDHLRQLALEVINNIPKTDIKIFTDGSKIEDVTGSGIYIETPLRNISLFQRNPDFCSVFRSELLAIEVGLGAITDENDFKDLWILSDSRSALQHLKDRLHIGDSTSISIYNKLKTISKHHEIHLHWVPSHVDIYGNEMADKLAKEGCHLPSSKSNKLTAEELFSLKKSSIKKDWLVPPNNNWYSALKPGFFLSYPGDRSSLTCLSRLASGHLKCLEISDGDKVFPQCPKCHQHQATPKHILDCLGFCRGDLYSSPLLIIDFLRVYGLFDLV